MGSSKRAHDLFNPGIVLAQQLACEETYLFVSHFRPATRQELRITELTNLSCISEQWIRNESPFAARVVQRKRDDGSPHSFKTKSCRMTASVLRDNYVVCKTVFWTILCAGL